MKFKTHGAMVDDFTHFYRDRFKTFAERRTHQEIFMEKIEFAHITFNRWCIINMVSPEDRNTLRKSILVHCKNYGYFRYQWVSYLNDYLPDSFNVRGVWTPPEIVV